jgi:pilus assembly protein Flp/PilA
VNLQKYTKKNELGVTMIEYALIAALVAIAAMVGLTALGVELNDFFMYIKNTLNGART